MRRYGHNPLPHKNNNDVWCSDVRVRACSCVYSCCSLCNSVVKLLLVLGNLHRCVAIEIVIF